MATPTLIGSFNLYSRAPPDYEHVVRTSAVCRQASLRHDAISQCVWHFHDNWPTTLAAAISTTSQISITLSSATNMPGGSAWNHSAVNALYKFSGSYAMPGGNMIQVDSEIMIVTAGWGTTTLTVTRGAESTTAATHSNGATVRWEQDYYSNNITFLNPAGACSEIDQQQSTIFYSSAANKQATNPSWVDVGNTSTGTISTQPNGANFALSGGSPAINYGTVAAPFNFLSAQAADSGACHHSFTVCP